MDASRMVTVVLRDGAWVCWGCGVSPVLEAWQLKQMERAIPVGSAHIIADVPHAPGCVLERMPCLGPGDYG